MTAKEYLSQAFTLDRLIKARESQIRDLREKQDCISPGTFGVNVQSSKSDKIADLTARLLDLIADYENDIERLLNLKAEIKRAIDGVENPTYQLILFERYINLKRWEDIAVDNNYGWQWVHKLHIRALREIKTGD